MAKNKSFALFQNNIDKIRLEIIINKEKNIKFI